MKTPDYWIDLSPRQQLNEAVRRYAQATGCEYRKAWFKLERLYFHRYGVDLTTERKRYGEKHGALPTIALWFEQQGLMNRAISLALTMGKQQC